MRIAFVAGLTDKKLAQKLAPLQLMETIEQIDLYRRKPYRGEKVRWRRVPASLQRSAFLGDIWRLLVLLANGWRYDLIIGCHQRFHGVLAEIAGRVWRKPVIQMLIGSVERAYGDPRYRWQIVNANGCAVRGEISVGLLRRRGFTGPIAVVANPYELPLAAPVVVPEAYDLIAVGNYADAKAFPWMIEVLAKVREHHPGVRLAIAGTGPYRERLGEQIARHGLNPNIDFLGWLDQAALDRAYQASSVLLLTSHSEGLPMVVVEAMSHGLPVVVTDVGEIRWLVQDGAGGNIVPYGDTEAMAVAVIRLLEDPLERNRQGAIGRERIEELLASFSTKAIAKAWEGLIAEVLDTHSPRSVEGSKNSKSARRGVG